MSHFYFVSWTDMTNKFKKPFKKPIDPLYYYYTNTRRLLASPCRFAFEYDANGASHPPPPPSSPKGHPPTPATPGGCCAPVRRREERSCGKNLAVVVMDRSWLFAMLLVVVVVVAIFAGIPSTCSRMERT